MLWEYSLQIGISIDIIKGIITPTVGIEIKNNILYVRFGVLCFTLTIDFSIVKNY